MNENNLTLKCVDDLLDEDFFVPDYQRGYRWTSTQVRALLDDIWQFRQESHEAPKKVFYCLQPIVVAHSENGWAIIDGQQRLTTLNLLLNYLDDYLGKRKRRNFGLTYQTRRDSQEYLQKLDPDVAKEDPDYYHMFKAYQEIEAWFDDKGGNAGLNFVQTLLNTDEEGKNVKVIWYEVDSQGNDHIDIFTRLNIGKIPLTNAELIKALLLRSGNFEEGRISLKQIQIATEWDQIERTLHKSEFWYFIYDKEHWRSYENRIEYIFDLMYDNDKEKEQYYTFFKFNEEAEKCQTENGKVDIDKLWLKVKRYFLTFEEWYQDRELYHMVGYLVSCGVSINFLKQLTEDNGVTKEDFRNLLKEKMAEQVKFHIDELEYGGKVNNTKIRKTLLLFNIQTLMINQGANIRFPFDRYKTENWDIEHIRSQTNRDINSTRQQRDWINDLIDYYTGYKAENFRGDTEEYPFDLSKLSDESAKICKRAIQMYFEEDLDSESFKQLRYDVETIFKERSIDGKSESEASHSIGNLALLDEETNRSYKNALFPIKRKRIIENDSIGKFVPICTKNVFLKYYSDQFDDVMYWKESDAVAYLKAIKKTLATYLPENPTKS